MATVVVVAGPALGLRIDVDRPLVIGRSGADREIADPECSRRHASLRPLPDGGIALSDLGSTNGTWVNGTRIAAEVTLRPGDVVQIGDTQLALEAEGVPSAAPPAPAPPAAPSPPPPHPPGVPPAPLPPVAAPAPAQPFGAFAPPAPAPRARRVAATRLYWPMVVTWAVVALTAVALIVYFAAR